MVFNETLSEEREKKRWFKPGKNRKSFLRNWIGIVSGMMGEEEMVRFYKRNLTK